MLRYFIYSFLCFSYLFCGTPNALGDNNNKKLDLSTEEAGMVLLKHGSLQRGGGTFDVEAAFVEENNKKHNEDDNGRRAEICLCAFATTFFGTVGTLSLWAFFQGMQN